MHILVSNDDGIYSPGIAVLAAVASEFGSVRVVAPDVERSSMGHAITASRPLSYRPTRIEGLTAYRVNGTPADCVSLGAYHWEKVDIVLSGLNLGFNLGNSIWHSGTVAAAKQAALLGSARCGIERTGGSGIRGGLRAAETMDSPGAADTAPGTRPSARERQLSAATARNDLDARVGEALRREDCADAGSRRTRTLLVHGHAHRRCR